MCGSELCFGLPLPMARKGWFTNWFNSPYYHQLYAHRDDKEAKAFLERLIAHLHPLPGATMLDMACGRGRHSRTLSGLGFDVTGVDVAPDNIRFAKRYETDQLHFQVHDMRKILCSRSFDYVFNFFTSFGYFDQLHQHELALHTMVTALKKGGVLVMDYLNSEYASQQLIAREEKTIKGTGFLITRREDARYFYKEITVTDPGLEKPLHFTEKVCKFSAGELQHMLQKQGMTIREIMGDYQLHAFDALTSPRLILIAEREQ
ncbi:MAG: class I SAM-dependent methyltransferase [Chitinophagia bacterium]|nr:class I SAM-dependent methyltransferase [Chitinophagia bacterium]